MLEIGLLVSSTIRYTMVFFPILYSVASLDSPALFPSIAYTYVLYVHHALHWTPTLSHPSTHQNTCQQSLLCSLATPVLTKSRVDPLFPILLTLVLTNRSKRKKGILTSPAPVKPFSFQMNLLFLLPMLPASHLLSAHFPSLTAAHHSSPCSFLLIHLTRHLSDLPWSKTMTRLFCSVREVCAQLAPWPQMAAREQPGQASRPLPPTERGGPR